MTDTGSVDSVSPNYAKFQEQFVGPGNRDGPDVRVLAALSPAERSQAEQVLLDRLPERRAMTGLVHLPSRRAVEPLREIMRGRRPDNVYAAIALWSIRPDPEALAVLCHSVRKPPRIGHRNERAYAASTLGEIDRREAVEALLSAIDDRNIAVRANAQIGVQEKLRLNAEMDAVDSGQLSRREYRRLAEAALDREFPR